MTRPRTRAPWLGGDPGTRGRLKPMRGPGPEVAARTARVTLGGTCAFAGPDCSGPLVATPVDLADPHPTEPTGYALACNAHAVERSYRHRHGTADTLTAVIPNGIPEEDPVTEPDPKADALAAVKRSAERVTLIEQELAAARATRRRRYLAARQAGASQREIAEAAGTSGPAVNDQLKLAEREAAEA